MKWLLSLFLLTTLAHAETSILIPAFLEAIEIYGSETQHHLYLRAEVRTILTVLREKNIPLERLEHVRFSKGHWHLRADDKFDTWIKNPLHQSSDLNVPKISFHATKIDVIKSSQYMGDDVYAYFFVTDGVIPTGKVTDIYKNISSRQGFFFNATDRAIFPPIGIPAKTPQNHLIVDYGIIESDGDDIKALQQLSSIIIDMAIAVYTTQNTPTGQVLVSLRKEIKALADLLLTQNSDDRLITGSIGYTSQEITELLSKKSYVDVAKSHQNEGAFGWDYKIQFRMLR